MKIDMHSGYIGNSAKWKNIMTFTLDNKLDILEEFFYFDLSLITKLKDYWYNILEDSYFSLSESVIDLPPSYIDLWESGLILFFDRFFALFLECHQKIDLEHGGTQNMYTFYNPANLQKLSGYVGREENENKYTGKVFYEDFSDEDLFKIESFRDEYLNYSNLDAFLSPPAPDFKTLINSYVIADGNFSYNDDICLLYQNIQFLDGEYETVVYNYDDGFIRYKSFAELFITNCLSYFYTDIESNNTITSYLHNDKIFKTLFKEGYSYTFSKQ